MNLFNWLLVGHFVGDYILQTKWMAEKKDKQFLPLLVHSLAYTSAIGLLALFAGGLSWWSIALIFIGHLVLDQRKFVDFWAAKINGNTNIGWLKITLDQSWHLVILAFATLIKI